MLDILLEALFKVLMLPFMILLEIFGVFVTLVGIAKLRPYMFFKDDIFEEGYHVDNKARKIILAIPLFVLLAIEIVVIIPVFLCSRIINTIMKAIPLIMIIPSFVFGAILAMLVFAFNFVNYYMLDESKRSQFTLADFVQMHPAAVVTQQLDK